MGDPAERVAFLEKGHHRLSLVMPSSPTSVKSASSAPPSPRLLAPRSPIVGTAAQLVEEGVGKTPRTWRRLVVFGLVGAAVLGSMGAVSKSQKVKGWMPSMPGTDRRVQEMPMDLGGMDIDVLEDIDPPAAQDPPPAASPSPAKALPLADRMVFLEKPKTAFVPLPTFTPSPSVPHDNVRPHPRLPPSRPDPDARYLTYSQHSGFHNQRKEIENAYLLAAMLNRTLLLPPARLGSAIPWAPTGRVQELWDEQIKAYDRGCLDHEGRSGTKGSVDPPSAERCELYSSWTVVQWDFLFDMTDVVSRHPTIDRWDYRLDWMWHALGLENGDWVQMQDTDRYSYQVSDVRVKPQAKWLETVTIDDLRAWDGVKLLELGSIYGSNRIRFMDRTPEYNKLKSRFSHMAIFRHHGLMDASDAIAKRIGGRGKYVGMHLRVGDLVFKNKAAINMPRVFREACSTLFGLDQKTIASLITRSASRAGPKPKNSSAFRRRAFEQRAWTTGDDDDDVTDDDDVADDEGVPIAGRAMTPALHLQPRAAASAMRCRGELHTDPALRSLNAPVYIATDSRDPLHDRNLKVFFDTFPCAFVLDDFAPSSNTGVGGEVEELTRLGRLRSSDDGLALAKFMYPMLEAVIVAKASGLVGTPSSTFSGYAISVLHPAYSAEAPAPY